MRVAVIVFLLHPIHMNGPWALWALVFNHGPFWIEYGSSDELFILLILLPLLIHTSYNSHANRKFVDHESVLIKHLFFTPISSHMHGLWV